MPPYLPNPKYSCCSANAITLILIKTTIISFPLVYEVDKFVTQTLQSTYSKSIFHTTIDWMVGSGNFRVWWLSTILSLYGEKLPTNEMKSLDISHKVHYCYQILFINFLLYTLFSVPISQSRLFHYLYPFS